MNNYFIFSYDADAVIDLKNVTMTIQDGAANSVEVTFDEGNFTWTETYARIYVKNRGLVGVANGGTVKNDDQTPMSVSFQGRYSFYISATDAKPAQILKNTGGIYTSTDPTNCAPYACDLFLNNQPQCADDELLKFPDFRVEQLDYDVSAGTISVSGNCNAEEPEVV